MAEARWPDDSWVQEQARRLAALPIALDLWSWWFLTPDGVVILVDGELEVGKTTRFTDRVKVASALVWGCEKYPELREALPPREAGAVDCPCRDIPRLSVHKMICGSCGGLGWVPEGRAEPDAAAVRDRHDGFPE